jgi:ribA/ribD-fused uncharacterized protein
MKEIKRERLDRTYSIDKAVVFYRTRESFGGLSNMASGYPLTVGGVHVPTAEALYQACRYPFDPDVQLEILDQRSPMTAKMKSKAHLSGTRQDWLRVRHNVMRWCLKVKLAQNYERFSELLIATGDLPIVEKSRKDRYWGAIPAIDGLTLSGRNVLGRLLMELREHLKSDPLEAHLFVAPPTIEDFLFLGRPVPTIYGRDSKMDERREQGTLL